MFKTILKIFKEASTMILCIALLAYSIFIGFTPNPTMHQLGALLGLIGVVIANLFLENNFRNSENKLIEQLELVRFQNLILTELRTNNERHTQFVKDQAELLTKMSAAALKIAPPKQESPN